MYIAGYTRSESECPVAIVRSIDIGTLNRALKTLAYVNAGVLRR